MTISTVSRVGYLRRYMMGGGEPLSDGSALRRFCPAVVRASGENPRAIDFIISTATPDRYGDTIAVNGWRLENFRKNPVVLWLHNNQQPPVAKASNVRAEGG